MSLDVVDATTTDGVLSWPVATQPWENGDQLMLRIRRAPTVTVTLRPRQGEYLTHTDMTITWTDPGTCASRYLVGLYDNIGSRIFREPGFPSCPGDNHGQRKHWVTVG